MGNFNIHSFYKKQYLAEALANDVDKIVDELKEKGIETSYAANFDPS